MYYYGYEEFQKDVVKLVHCIQKDFKPDVLVAVARGGMSLGHCLALALNTRLLFSINSIHYEDTQKLNSIEIFNIPELGKYKNILLIDDIVDSGESLDAIIKVLKGKFPHLHIKTATLFYKKTALLIPDFKIKEAQEWIRFPWEI
ncbi:phosphoribosyltransferase family protein [Campylobacter sp. MIT 21-1685]|uniref:phosphoribosyltransferase n=1 Tax=unclassified Campylobacter TaxID=2593542 RepID=UPI00224B7D4D|nr:MULTISPECIES: phosphoribosyltransferase family protein [unclassified Campylobacter]MCX2683176.1 phosphoribosyltransferase family protein [Campylobacter sp. MIT 21-1684]MCX2751504.1 phosphoribosyltransferase family protein [Campylobacter sp. MIT 21-1682]MCX2807657.1 phosphoribosyltransferase family protein [Campylobacter sp. MIT 21-1685]